MTPRHIRDARWCYLHAMASHHAIRADFHEPTEYIEGDREQFLDARKNRDWLFYFEDQRRAVLYNDKQPPVPLGEPPERVRDIVAHAKNVEPGKPGEPWAEVAIEKLGEAFRELADAWRSQVTATRVRP